MRKFESIKKMEWPSWMPVVLAILGAFLYLIQAVIYAHTTVTSLDEGSYLLKGILYLRGVYEPFEPYGPLTNKAPFAFLIPGFAEFLFGPGLRTGRFFSIFLGLLTMLGVWITARRWAGKWIAAGTVWVFALSPVIIRIHSVAVSEVIIAFMLTWMCVCVLGEDRPLWQIVLGSIFAALAVLTRQNMAPVLPLLVLYVFWQYGKIKGIWSFIAGALVFLAVHAYYWPNILTIWAPWLPDSLTPFLDPFRLPKDALTVWDPSIDVWNRTIAFFQGIRYHFIPVVGSIFALVLWSRPRDWKAASPRGAAPAIRAAVFLALLYFILFTMHAWAAVASQYESYSCVYCFANYLGFFDPLGILLLVIALSASWKCSPSRVMGILAILLVLVLSVGIGFSSFENVGSSILNMPVPRMRDGQFLPGTTLLVDLIKNKFGFALPVIKRYISSAIGLAVGFGILLIAFFMWHRRSAKNVQTRSSFAFILLNAYLVLGLLLSPLLNAGGSQIHCKQDLLAANEQLGAHLARVIPPDSLVYWDGGLSFTPMVYVPNVRIFPPQINDGYAYKAGGDPDVLLRFGYWNSVLLTQWRDSADIFIIEVKRYPYWKDYLNPQEFEEYQKPPTAPTCNDGAGLRIFHRLP